MDRGAWWAAVHGVAKSRTWLSDFTFTFHFHALEKELATHSSIIAWRIPGMGEPGGLLSMGLHRVGHDRSDLATAAAELNRASLVAQMVKNLPARRETWIRSLTQEDPLEKEMATHSSILAWRIPWTEEPGGLQSMGSQRVGYEWATNTELNTFFPLVVEILVFFNIGQVSHWLYGNPAIVFHLISYHNFFQTQLLNGYMFLGICLSLCNFISKSGDTNSHLNGWVIIKECICTCLLYKPLSVTLLKELINIQQLAFQTCMMGKNRKEYEHSFRNTDLQRFKKSVIWKLLPTENSV